MTKNFFSPLGRWQPPRDWLRITTLDVHTEGEPLRIILDGFPAIKGSTVLERRRFVKRNCDAWRQALMLEPRGHADMYGALIVEPDSDDAHFGVLFMHNEGYSTGCGHAVIALATVAVETGLVPMTEPETLVKMDTPSGSIPAYARCENGRVTSVRFQNIPSFVVALDATVDVPGLGTITYDLAYGGAFYAYVQAEAVGLQCLPEYHAQLIDVGMNIKRAVMASREITHPFEPGMNFLYGTILLGPPVSKEADSRNVCVFAEGAVDRSPTGTGVSGRMAIHYARGEIGIGEPMVIESIIGSRFTGSVVKTIDYGPYKAVIPQVEGTAHIIGRNELFIDPADPLKSGFILR